jgi:hypothetical protein
MKYYMKKIQYILALTLPLLVLSCGEDFLDSKQLYQKLDVNYYSNPQEIDEALTAAYASLVPNEGANNPTLVSELMSDDRLGGGGTNDVDFKDNDAFEAHRENLYSPLWTRFYTGIFRANMILKRFDQAKYENEADKNQAHGEAYFLRAYYYFRLAQFFGTVPLITDPAPVNVPKASPEDLFAQIASDLKTAIELMPSTPYSTINTERLGHATKWAAEGLMARAYLFYTGYYNKTELPVAGGDPVTKDKVIAWVDECIASSGHHEIPDFRNLWPYAYSPSYPYALNNHLAWIGEDGKNTETVFAVKYSPYGDWNSATGQTSYSNQMVLYMGIRGANNNLVPFGQGWGGGPVNPQLWDSFEPGDLRREGSIINFTNPEEGPISTNYQWNGDNSQQETGFMQKKYVPIVDTNVSSTGTVTYIGMFANPKSPYYLTFTRVDMQMWNVQDEIVIRFTDILLMGAELGSTNAQAYFDRVRTRAGLTSKPVTLENIKLERRHELAFEGVRYFDLLRWHDAEAAFAIATNIPIKTVGIDEIYTVTFRPETGGFLPIPESQIKLSNGVLTQNPGW